MASGNKSTLGERLANRLLQRSSRRPRMGFTPQFFLRLGLNDPWLPEAPVGPSERSDGFVYVSGQPFYEMLQRLAQARWRRDHRLARYGQGMAAMRLRPLTRMVGATSAVLRTFALPSVGAQDMVVPAWEGDAAPRPVDIDLGAVPGRQPVAARQRNRRERGPAWLQRPWEGARVAQAQWRGVDRVIYVDKAASPGGRPVVRELRGAAARKAAGAAQPAAPSPRPWAGIGDEHSARADVNRVRPLERASGRSAVSSPEIERVRAIAGRMGRSARAAELIEVIESSADLAPEARVRALRRVIRRAGPAGRLVQAEVEEALEDRAVRPLTVAGGRLGGRADRRSRGLRPVLGSSPMVDALRLEASSQAAQPVEAIAVQAIKASRLSRSPVVRTARARAPRPASTPRVATSGGPRSASAGSDGPPGPPGPTGPTGPTTTELLSPARTRQAGVGAPSTAGPRRALVAADRVAGGELDADLEGHPSVRRFVTRATAHLIARGDSGVADALVARRGRDVAGAPAPQQSALRRLAPVRDARQRFVAAMQLPQVAPGGQGGISTPSIETGAGMAPMVHAGEPARRRSALVGPGPSASVWADARAVRDDGAAGRSVVPRPVLSRASVGAAARLHVERTQEALLAPNAQRASLTPNAQRALLTPIQAAMAAGTPAREAADVVGARVTGGRPAVGPARASQGAVPTFLSQVQRAVGRGDVHADHAEGPVAGLATSRRAQQAVQARRSDVAPRTRPTSAAVAEDGTFLSSRSFETGASTQAAPVGSPPLAQAAPTGTGRTAVPVVAQTAARQTPPARTGPVNRSKAAARSGVEHAVARLAGGQEDVSSRSLVPAAVPALSTRLLRDASGALPTLRGTSTVLRGADGDAGGSEVGALRRLDTSPDVVRRRDGRADAPTHGAVAQSPVGVLPQAAAQGQAPSSGQVTVVQEVARARANVAPASRGHRTPQAVRAALRSQATGVVFGGARERAEPVEVAVPSRFGSLGPTSYVASLLGRWSRDVQVQAGSAPGQVVLTPQRPAAVAGARGADAPPAEAGLARRAAPAARRRDQRAKASSPQYALVREVGARRTPLQWVDIRSLGIDPAVAAAVVNEGAPTSIARLGAQVRRSAAVGAVDSVTLRAAGGRGGAPEAGAAGSLRGVVGRTPWRARPSARAASTPTFARANSQIEASGAAAAAGRRGWLTSPFGARETDLSGRGVAPLDTRWATAALPTQAYTLPHSAGLPKQLFDAPPDADRAGRQEGRGLGRTLGTVEGGRVDTSLPVWAQRSHGEPRIRQAGDLVAALVAAGSADEVVQVLARRSADLDMVASTLPQPVIQIIRQIQGESDAAAQAQGDAGGVRTSDGIRGRQPRGDAPRSSARVVRGFSALRAHRGAAAGAGIGSDKVMKLASRLQDLVTLAELARRKDQARAEVRMAEDSAAARQEGQAAPTQASAEGDGEVDVEALGREVLEVVARELEMRRERRLEDPDERSIWW